MIARDPRQTWTYVLDRDLKDPKVTEAECTIFEFRHLSILEEADINNDLEIDPIAKRFIRRNLGTQLIKSLRRGLKGWKNMPDGKGGFVEFQADAEGIVTDESLGRIRREDRYELARAVENETAVTAAELSKSKGARAPDLGESLGAVPAMSPS